MGQCAFPYQEKEVVATAKKKGYICNETDLHQLLALNWLTYLMQQWMKMDSHLWMQLHLEDQKQVIHGFMDLVIWNNDSIVIVDYKTDTSHKRRINWPLSKPIDDLCEGHASNATRQKNRNMDLFFPFKFFIRIMML